MRRDMTTVAQGSWVERIAKLQDSKSYAELHWEGSFEEYLNLIRQNPRVTRTAFQRKIPPSTAAKVRSGMTTWTSKGMPGTVHKVPIAKSNESPGKNGVTTSPVSQNTMLNKIT